MRARAHPVFAILACLFALLPASFPGERVFAADAGGSSPERSAALFEKMVPVLMHPRCLNCHSRADFPRQGDDRHRHTMNVSRGPDDHGAPALQCKTCHQAANQPASGVPGAPDWHLAPLRMAWEGLSAGELCRALLDPQRGGMPPEKLVAHLNTALVRWAWAPGTNAQGAPRSTPPLSHEALVEVARQWLASGSECPDT
ncbi:MAG: hypothetical protein E6K48_13510 [Gammaproteobacteria bacterium]|nr:MAG: hypothetical protein E6K48_13510 [Gammaproteobacteria bacterium]